MNKNFAILFFLLLSVYTSSQTITGRVVDSITKAPLDAASLTFINTNFGIYTNADGAFKITLGDNKDHLRISNIGYETKTIKLSHFSEKNIVDTIFYLNPKAEKLQDVTIESKKANYGWDKSINYKENKTGYFAFQFGTENCSYIANNYNKKGKIKLVTIDLKKVKDHAKPCKMCKVDYITAYNIKFYSFDANTNQPGNEIYNKNLVVEPGNMTGKFMIDVDSLSIPFPKNGICIGIETLNTKYSKPKKAGALTGPAINFTDSEQPSWVRYRNEGWLFKNAITGDYNKKRYNSIIIDIVAKFQE